MGEINNQKLTIKIEAKGSTAENLSFDDSVSALFNPDKLVFSKSASWEQQDAQQRDCPELQFKNSQPRTLKLDLIFDTFDPEDISLKDQDIRKVYTSKFYHLMTVEKHGDKHRPPICRLFWDGAGFIFQGVLQQLEQQFTLFSDHGVPVRAKLSCSFMEWRTNKNDREKQDLQSSDIAKVHVVKRGDTLSSIAMKEYSSPKIWRIIARENAIDDPRKLEPGRVLLLPTVSNQDLVV
jgi:nucleoid-associated protein YgaU